MVTWQVLPALLRSGALCRLTHLHVEWHMKALNNSASRAFADGIKLRLGLDHLIEHGCGGRSDGSSGSGNRGDRSDPKEAVLGSALRPAVLVDHEHDSSRILAHQHLNAEAAALNVSSGVSG